MNHMTLLGESVFKTNIQLCFFEESYYFYKILVT